MRMGIRVRKQKITITIKYKTGKGTEETLGSFIFELLFHAR